MGKENDVQRQLEVPVAAPDDKADKQLCRTTGRTALQAKLRVREVVVWPILLLIAGCLGLVLASLLSDADTTASLVSAHLPTQGRKGLTFWLRLCLQRLPVWLLWCAAGLCAFGRGLSKGLAVFCGLSDGAALYALQTSGTSAHAAVLPFLICTLILYLPRVALALTSCMTSSGLADPTVQLQPGERGLSPLLAVHAAVSLSAGLLTVIVQGLYSLWLYQIM